jgi:AdoMet-dependent rRNA methyltransferase SPB1
MLLNRNDEQVLVLVAFSTGLHRRNRHSYTHPRARARAHAVVRPNARYRSRAAFKLIQLNRKYDFLSSARTVVDLCAAPGGWSQVAAKTCPVGATIMAIDLLPIKAIRGVKTLIGDITTQECRHLIKKETKGELIDVVLCDGAPNVGGAWSSEAYTQSELVLEAARMASDILAPGGTFVSKVFRSKDYSALIYALKQLYKKVEATKPAASRNTSAEIFVVCQGYKAPSKIDARLFDSKYIFTDFTEEKKIEGPDALLRAKDKQRRFREGYEEGISTTFKEIAVEAFVKEDSPVEVLGKYTKISFKIGAAAGDGSGDEELEVIREVVATHKATTSEIKSLCEDLQVLGRSEFKQLLRWRLAVKKEADKVLKERRKAAGGEEGEDEGADADAGGEGGDEEEKSQEDRLMEEMEAVKAKMEKRLKREKKKRREQKMNARIRSAQLAQAEGIGEDLMDGPESLFSLKGIKGKVKRVSDVSAPDQSDSEEAAAESESESDDSDLDERRRKYDAMMDEYLEANYKDYKVRQRMTAGGALRKKRSRLGDDGELSSDEEDAGGDDDAAEAGSDSAASEDGSEDGSEDEEDGLLTDLGAKKGITPVDTWFDQDVFAGNMGDDESSDGDEEEEEEEDVEDDVEVDVEVDDGGADASSSDEDEQDMRSKGKTTGGGSRPQNGFEEVPMSEDDSDSAAEEFDMLGDDAKAEVLALAKKFINKKSKSELLESSYNRYAFHDDEKDLPGWFREEEAKFRRPAYQITGQEFNDAKNSLAGINTRTTKKVVEAKARKQKRLKTKLDAARKAAEAVASHEDMSGASKMRQIEKIYRQARSKGPGKKKMSRSEEYKSKKRAPKLDARLRADKRGLKAAEARAKKKRGGKGRR